MSEYSWDVLFINPSIKKETQSPLFTSVVFSGMPQGLGYVAAYLRAENGVPVRVIDEAMRSMTREEVAAEIRSYPRKLIVGFSCLTATYSRVLEVATWIKEERPDVFIVSGGAHPSALPEESLATGLVDVVVRGEGELTMKELYDTLSNGGDISTIKGISYRRKGVIQHNPHRMELINLDRLPPFPYDLFEQHLGQYSDFGNMLTSRGCPFDCIFCSNRIVTGKKYRVFSVDYVLAQVEMVIRKYHQRSIFFIDDNFMADRKRFFTLTNAIIERGLHREAFFIVQGRGEDMTDDVMAQLKKTNVHMASCGIETSSNRLMKILRKNELVEDIARGVEMAHKNGMLTCGTFIFGIPTETREERWEAMRFSRRLPLDSTRFNIAIPYPGTTLYEIAKKENRLHVAEGWRNFNVQYYMFGDDIPYYPATTGKYALIFDIMWANLRFYLRWKTLMTILFKTDSTGGGVLSLQNRRKSWRTHLTLIRIALFIARRFIYIAFRAMLESVSRPR